MKKYRAQGGKIVWSDIAPVLYLKNEDAQSGGGHYFYQDIWALRKLRSIAPYVHYDIGSRYDGFVGQATAITKVISIDIRKPSFSLPDFEFQYGDITNLDIPANSIYSVSCLHTLEHIGLGRYGDRINPGGFSDGLLTLQHIIAPGGHLLISFPVGRPRVEFNAQRVLDPTIFTDLLPGMELLEFSVVNDHNEFIANAWAADYINAKYACGLYHFVKKSRT
ncbi:DUF268 domain-containing protein [Sediminibacterium ginsengisoli]|uniref:DUF268 domain-containing protein n=1 Tax=Sediminibacterium ginsengisoli TaxID=413434 RepID=UPI001591F7C8|nr:DUF268 domain-containing protein [Sediminibacterium ginsengisoli]